MAEKVYYLSCVRHDMCQNMISFYPQDDKKIGTIQEGRFGCKRVGRKIWILLRSVTCRKQ